MKFEYRKQPNFTDPNKPWISRPIIPVRLLHGSRHIDVYALVDSGADTALFHSSIAKELGLEVEKGRPQKFFGIAEVGIDVYFHTIELQIVGTQDSIRIEAGFTHSKGVGAILGQSGFFDDHHIKFERDKERIEITPAKK